MNDDDPSRWSPELRRAVISVQPACFGWPVDEQLRWRAELPDDDREALVTALLRAHGRRRPAAAAKRSTNGCNFDPKVTTLRKRRKIMLHPQALRDLEDGGAS